MEKSFTADYIIRAFNLISKARKFIAFPQGGGFYQQLSLTDIKGYFDIYGCDMDKAVFLECIYALDAKWLERNK